jgi:hypothetical protein
MVPRPAREAGSAAETSRSQQWIPLAVRAPKPLQFEWSAADCLERLARGETVSGLIDLIRQADVPVLLSQRRHADCARRHDGRFSVCLSFAQA